ncbi:hypothetical protein ACTFIZ_008926 [Dictyostelium cf. discoideum]
MENIKMNGGRAIEGEVFLNTGALYSKKQGEHFIEKQLFIFAHQKAIEKYNKEITDIKKEITDKKKEITDIKKVITYKKINDLKKVIADKRYNEYKEKEVIDFEKGVESLFDIFENLDYPTLDVSKEINQQKSYITFRIIKIINNYLKGENVSEDIESLAQSISEKWGSGFLYMYNNLDIGKITINSVISTGEEFIKNAKTSYPGKLPFGNLKDSVSIVKELEGKYGEWVHTFFKYLKYYIKSINILANKLVDNKTFECSIYKKQIRVCQN